MSNTDTERIDFLESLEVGPGRWILRMSTRGSGVRLHQSNGQDAPSALKRHKTAREAIDAAIQERKLCPKN